MGAPLEADSMRNKRCIFGKIRNDTYCKHTRFSVLIASMNIFFDTQSIAVGDGLGRNLYPKPILIRQYMLICEKNQHFLILFIEDYRLYKETCV